MSKSTAETSTDCRVVIFARMCTGLFAYAMERLERCPYPGTETHLCQLPDPLLSKKKREQVRLMMRYAGPKMLLRHPILAVRHLIDGRMKAPALFRQAVRNDPEPYLAH